jgi:hypothetical protein
VPVLLLLVLVLVLSAFGLLVMALVTDQAGWAWGSVATSAVAGVLLAADWIARPSRVAERDTPQAPPVGRTDTSTQRTTAAEPGDLGHSEPD